MSPLPDHSEFGNHYRYTGLALCGGHLPTGAPIPTPHHTILCVNASVPGYDLHNHEIAEWLANNPSIAAETTCLIEDILAIPERPLALNEALAKAGEAGLRQIYFSFPSDKLDSPVRR